MPGGPQQHGGVAVMAAGMHGARGGRGIGCPGSLLDRQRVHVGAQHDRLAARPAAPVQHAQHTGAADAGLDHVETQPGQPLGHLRRRPVFFVAKLRMAVEILAPFRQFTRLRGYRVRDRLHRVVS
jgi:hypothetical protein